MKKKMSNRHKEIADAFAALNSTLNEKKEEYLEKISKVINKAIKKYDDKDFWKESYDKIVNLMYAALTDTYLETSITLKKIYNQITDTIPNIEDFIYKDDKITLQQRIKDYWNEASNFLKNPEINTQEISLHLLTMYNRILNNEMINVKQGVKKVKKPIANDNEIITITITNGECCSNGGFYLEEEAPELPPYHLNCECDYWYDTYNIEDEQDLEELQEAGWEEEDG